MIFALKTSYWKGLLICGPCGMQVSKEKWEGLEVSASWPLNYISLFYSKAMINLYSLICLLKKSWPTWWWLLNFQFSRKLHVSLWTVYYELDRTISWKNLLRLIYIFMEYNNRLHLLPPGLKTYLYRCHKDKFMNN